MFSRYLSPRVEDAIASVPAGLAVIVALTGFSTDARAADVSGSAALTTDYVFRGITQTQGDPAAQFGVKAATANGFYANIWASTVEFPGDTGATTEADYIVGWGGKLNDDFALDVNVTHFDYPSARADLAYTELIGTLTWRDNYWLMVGYSPDVFATDGDGLYTQLGAKVPISEQFRFEASIAHYDLDDAYGRSYSHASLGAVWAFKAPFELRVTAHDTDSYAERLFPGLAGSRIEAALQASF